MLDQLEELVDNARQLFGRAYGVDIDQFYLLTNKIRSSLPEEVRKATKITSQSERMLASARDEGSMIVEDARREATQIVEEARRQQEKLVTESEIHRLAVAQARELVDNAEKKAQLCRDGADRYAHDVLSELEELLTRFMGAVTRGKECLEAEHSAPSSQEKVKR